jgi:uncharacterized protein
MQKSTNTILFIPHFSFSFMLIILSPAKTLDFDKTIPYKKHTIPIFLKDSSLLVNQLKKLSPKQLQSLMEISSDLANLTHQRYKRWKTPFTTKNARPAIFTFNGPVYQGFDFLAYKTKDYERLQKTIRIISGLHGILKPLDLIQAYRLDMHTTLKNHKGNNLYELWRQKITDQINMENPKILVNCASKEYFEAIDLSQLKCKIITIHFKNLKHGKYQVIGLFAKKARGMFADFLVKNNYTKINDFKKFKKDGYIFDSTTSNDTDLVFLRKKI